MCIDGILVASSRISDNYSRRPRYTNIPTVLINSQIEGQANLLHWISVDDCQGAQMAVDHLLQLGHRAIGYLGSNSRPGPNRQRLRGYQNALQATGIDPSPAWIVEAPGDEASDEAISLINASSYGNMACLFTSSGAAARKFRYEARAGNIGTELGDWDFMPTEPAQLRSELQHRALAMVGAFVPAALANPVAHSAGPV